MGYYINPPTMAKEEWLANQSEFSYTAPKQYRDEKHVAVVLVDNGMFTAAGIAYDQHELAAFAREDGRAKLWFWVPIAEIVALHPHMEGVVK